MTYAKLTKIEIKKLMDSPGSKFYCIGIDGEEIHVLKTLYNCAILDKDRIGPVFCDNCQTETNITITEELLFLNYWHAYAHMLHDKLKKA